MQLRVSAPGTDLHQEDVDRIERDLAKLDRRLQDQQDFYVECRVNGTGEPNFHVTLEIEYGRNHLVAKAEQPDIGRAVREARDEVIRQINDRSRGSHSDYAKGR